jgi:hypothetical protein
LLLRSSIQGDARDSSNEQLPPDNSVRASTAPLRARSHMGSHAAAAATATTTAHARASRDSSVELASTSVRGAQCVRARAMDSVSQMARATAALGFTVELAALRVARG